jgi:Icc-related predicted phosphoesterase
MAEDRLTVAAIGDIHVGETSVTPYRELFQEIADRANVLALAGDLTNHGKPHEAEILAHALVGIGIPVVAVFGNHDHECGHEEEVQRILEQAGVRFLDGSPQVIRGVGFAGVKGFGGGFENRMLDAFGESIIKQFVHEAVNEAMRLESALRQLETERVMTVLHYAPVAATVQGEPPEIYPFLGSSRLAETIDRFGNVRAVVHGHAHHGTYEGRTMRGTPVYNVAQNIGKASGRPYALIEI